MKALTIQQPWASLIADHRKKIETRSWSTPHRGPIAIHAAMRSLDADLAVLCGYEPNDLPRGAVLCIAQLVAIERVEEVRGDLLEQELLFGNYGDGRYAWFLENVEQFERPIPARGALGLWEWNNKP